MSSRRVYLLALILILALQGLDQFYLGARASGQPELSLHSFPPVLGEWRLLQEARFDEEILGALSPDDYLIRFYGRRDRPRNVELMIAHFRSQLEGFGPHSPRVCLPAAGWEPVSHSKIRIADGEGGTFPANRFLLQDGRRFSLVLYWYHSRSRVTAGEMEARFWLAWDTLSRRQNDISLVRVIVPVSGPGESAGEELLSGFAGNVYSSLRRSWGPS